VRRKTRSAQKTEKRSARPPCRSPNHPRGLEASARILFRLDDRLARRTREPATGVTLVYRKSRKSRNPLRNSRGNLILHDKSRRSEPGGEINPAAPCSARRDAPRSGPRATRGA
jgi:hypothetical protein